MSNTDFDKEIDSQAKRLNEAMKKRQEERSLSYLYANDNKIILPSKNGSIIPLVIHNPSVLVLTRMHGISSFSTRDYEYAVSYLLRKVRQKYPEHYIYFPDNHEADLFDLVDHTTDKWELEVANFVHKVIFWHPSRIDGFSNGGNFVDLYSVTNLLIEGRLKKIPPIYIGTNSNEVANSELFKLCSLYIKQNQTLFSSIDEFLRYVDEEG